MYFSVFLSSLFFGSFFFSHFLIHLRGNRHRPHAVFSIRHLVPLSGRRCWCLEFRLIVVVVVVLSSSSLELKLGVISYPPSGDVRLLRLTALPLAAENP